MLSVGVESSAPIGVLIAVGAGWAMFYAAMAMAMAYVVGRFLIVAPPAPLERVYAMIPRRQLRAGRRARSTTLAPDTALARILAARRECVG